MTRYGEYDRHLAESDKIPARGSAVNVLGVRMCPLSVQMGSVNWSFQVG